MPHPNGPSLRPSFREGDKYTRDDVFDVLGLIPHPIGGPWFTGYASLGSSHFIFCNVGAPGRTGHDYGNRWEGVDRIRWFGKGPSAVHQPQIKAMTSGSDPVHLFFRSDNRASFEYAGKVRALQVGGARPVEVLWQVLRSDSPLVAEEILHPERYYEGATTRIVVNAYERNRAAREACVEHFGYQCSVCDMDFVSEYGEIGKEFIHVHHTVQLKTIRKTYRVDPIEHLRPVCPNCHSMLHRKDPPFEVEELREIVQGIRRSRQMPG